MVSNGEKCLYLTVKTSAHVGGFYCFNCFYLSSFVKIIRESLKNVRQKKKKKKKKSGKVLISNYDLSSLKNWHSQKQQNLSYLSPKEKSFSLFCLKIPFYVR